MAREKKVRGDEFGDIQDGPTLGNGFANIPMPPQEVIDQEADALPQIEPEQMLTHSAPRAQTTVRVGRSMKQIIDQFLADINGHPDCNLLGSAFGGKPAKSVEFANTPLANQHMVELRFVWRDEVQQIRSQEAAPSAFAPGGRYYDLIPKRGQQEVAAESNQNADPAWKNLVRQRETANV